MSRNRFMNSSNPFVGEQQFAKQASQGGLGITRSGGDGAMTIQGAVNKTLILTLVLIVSAFLSVIYLPFSQPMLFGGAFLGLGILLVSYFKPTIAPITAPLYAVVEGYLLGHISYLFAAMVGSISIVFNAVLLTMFCLVSMLVAYKTGLIKPTQKFRSMVMTATGAIFFIYLINMVLHLFGTGLPYLHEGGVIGIGLSLVIIVVATLNLILDFDNIERGAAMGAPKYMEWVSSLGLLVTLIWLYLEILRLLAMFSSSD